MPQNSAPLSPGQRAKALEALDRVLASQAFRKSEQCQRFLRYVVEHSHTGEDELLRERTIGMEVFGRPADYDTADDPVVRVRATEVRKRLAQYQAESGDPGEVRIEIPSGCYRAEFHWPETGVVPPLAAQGTRSAWKLAGLAGAVLFGLFLASILRRPSPPPSALERFWAPVIDTGKPVLIYCGQPVVYFLSREVHEKYRKAIPTPRQRGSYAIPLDPDASLRGSDIIPVTDQFVGIGNAHTSALLAAMFAARQKTVEIRYANDLSFSDLRRSPSVLIGAFSNLWTLEMQGQLRFLFEQEDGARRIRDKTTNQVWQLANLAQDGKTPEDYAVVSRLFDSGTGQLLITAAGITQYGTRAAGEFLSSASLLREALAKARQDWPQRNIQVLLHTAVYGGTPATPTVVATQVW